MNTNDLINDLCRRAKRLAPAAAESALDSGNTDLRPAGPRSGRAWDLVALAHDLNAVSDVELDAGRALALVAERAGEQRTGYGAPVELVAEFVKVVGR